MHTWVYWILTTSTLCERQRRPPPHTAPARFSPQFDPQFQKPSAVWSMLNAFYYGWKKRTSLSTHCVNSCCFYAFTGLTSRAKIGGVHPFYMKFWVKVTALEGNLNNKLLWLPSHVYVSADRRTNLVYAHVRSDELYFSRCIVLCILCNNIYIKIVLQHKLFTNAHRI